ncbi:MAG: GNAT family N-acetyltransferase, partial [Oscillospiraceae bacterium]|nr:GNAT family N-acetyltransferase [Oscillospiraceae bacterium]
TALMQSMLAVLKDAGYRQASLSVQKENYAARMYRKLGFRTIAETDEDYLMVYDLTGQPDAASGIC